MSGTPGVVERLRVAFAADDRGPAPGETCPDPAALWEVQHEPGGGQPARRVVDHVARCPTCAAEWRLAMGEGARAGAAALAAGLGAVAILGPWRPEPGAPPFRSLRGDAAIRSIVPEDRALPRGAFVLRWSSVAPQARYSVVVTLPSLRSVASARGLEDPEFQVPESALDGLPAGSPIVWRVEATPPGGARVSSPTFVHRIE
jgi:hypothetical protein